jgi:cobalt/nickel transport protein
MKKAIHSLLHFFMILFFSSPAFAHFGMVIPSDPMVLQGENRTITLDLLFWHPFEGEGMDLERPVRFGVVVNGKDHDLLASLKETKQKGRKAWRTDYTVRRPGLYVFYMEPQPYFEPGEDLYIVHYTKTVVASFGEEEGWDTPVGLKAEIIPLTRPFGLYTGNVFQGRVLLDGKPVPNARVEVELFNRGRYTPPNEYFETQVVRADENGIFTYAAPVSGWWGFAALMEGKEKIRGKGVEIGAVIWVRFDDPVRRDEK